jgi:hypothetical protein
MSTDEFAAMMEQYGGTAGGYTPAEPTSTTYPFCIQRGDGVRETWWFTARDENDAETQVQRAVSACSQVFGACSYNKGECPR